VHKQWRQTKEIQAVVVVVKVPTEKKRKVKENRGAKKFSNLWRLTGGRFGAGWLYRWPAKLLQRKYKNGAHVCDKNNKSKKKWVEEGGGGGGKESMNGKSTSASRRKKKKKQRRKEDFLLCVCV